jgi:hypothetical protein
MGIASPIARFALRAGLWLPPCFAAWYFAAKYIAPIVGACAMAAVSLFKPALVASLEHADAALVFVTTLRVHPQPGQAGILLVEVNPLLYTAGLPLLVALMLASRAPWWKILAGAALLLPFQAWGVAFDFLAQVGVKAGWEVSSQAGLMGWRAEVIALAYQLGSLIFPALAPVALWMALNRRFFTDLVQPNAHPRESVAAVK